MAVWTVQEEAAAHMHDEEAVKLFGPAAKLNYPPDEHCSSEGTAKQQRPAPAQAEGASLPAEFLAAPRVSSPTAAFRQPLGLGAGLPPLQRTQEARMSPQRQARSFAAEPLAQVATGSGCAPGEPAIAAHKGAPPGSGASAGAPTPPSGAPRRVSVIFDWCCCRARHPCGVGLFIVHGVSGHRIPRPPTCLAPRLQVWQGNEVLHIGYFDDEKVAARAFDRSVLKLRGPSATTNFPASEYGAHPAAHEGAAAPQPARAASPPGLVRCSCRPVCYGIPIKMH